MRTLPTGFGAGRVFALQFEMEVAPMSVGEDAPLKAPLMEVVDVVEEQESGLPPEDSRDPEEVASQAGSGSDGDSSEDDWESESLYEDALQLISDAQLRNGGKANTYHYATFLPVCRLGTNTCSQYLMLVHLRKL